MFPQHLADPLWIAHDWPTPAEIAVTPDSNPDTCTGTLLSVVLPSPSRPFKLYPQHLAAPLWIAHDCWPTAEIAVTPDSNPDTCTGTLLSMVLLLPSCQKPFSPQHLAAPLRIAHVWVPPAESAVTVGVGGSVVVVVVEVVEVVVVVLAARPGALGLGPLVPPGPAHTADAALLSAATVARTTSVFRFIRSLPVAIRL